MQLDKIKSYANEKGLMLKYLAEKAGVSYQNLNRSIKENKISAQHLENIANILEVDINEFFNTNTRYTSKQQTKSLANEPSDKYSEEAKLKREIELLKKDIKFYKSKIEALVIEIEDKKKIIKLLEDK